ncbi:MAG: NAD(+)/NADH kinase [Defluviitaleaceae bacterium]|nr:NAD(+)/NADH kinase [Defluviitaleaceae bacterium]
MSMTIGIISNASRDIGLAFTNEVTKWLISKDCKPILEPAQMHKSNFLLVLGGDGTMLQAASLGAKHDIPILGINLGSLGYLTDVDRNDGIAAIEKMLAGNFISEYRMMLEVDNELALNDVVIHGNGMLISVRICINGNHMDTIRADGIIVSTPTGSTAYNLSAGGPILRPDSEMIVLTAVCPHNLYTRPWVLSATDELTLASVNEHEKKVIIYMDGVEKLQIMHGESVTVKSSQYKTTIVKTAGIDFFEILRKKMGGQK